MTKSITVPTGWKAPSSGGGTGGAVTSVDGRTGVVVLTDLYTNKTGDTMTGLLTVPTLAVGTNPAAVAAIRLASTGIVRWRKTDNSADGGYILQDPSDSSVYSTPNWHRFYAAGTEAFTIQSTGVFSVVPWRTSGSLALGATPPATGAVRLTSGTTAAEGIQFGADTNLYRSAPDVLHTDDQFEAVRALTDAPGASRGVRISNIETNTVSMTGQFVIGADVEAVTQGAGNHSANNGALGMQIGAYHRGAGTQDYVRCIVATVGSSAGAGTVAVATAIEVYSGIGAPATNNSGIIIHNMGGTNRVNATGVAINATSGASAINRTLHVSSDVDPTTPAGGITFGSSADTNLYRSAAGVLKTDGAIAVGATPALTGDIRLSFSGIVKSRNSGNTTDVSLLSFTTGNTLVVGGSGVSSIQLMSGASVVLAVGSSGISVGTGQSFILNDNKFGTSAGQKLAFWNATPVAQPAGTTDLRQALVDVGLRAAGGATPLDLGGGTMTAGTVAVGTNPAGVGALRLPNNTHIAWRNAANTVDARVFALGSNDRVKVGTADIASGLDLYGSDVSLYANNVKQVEVGPTYLALVDGTNLAAGQVTGTKIGTTTGQKFAFWNATPIVQPTGTPAAATDPATTQALANSLRTALIALGLVS